MKFIILILLSFQLFACAKQSKNFSKIYPGMHTKDVVIQMESGPNKVENFKDGYVAWYYGKDHCLLFQADKVIDKEVSEKKSSLEAFDLGGYSSKKLAQCLPPGIKREEKLVRKIETPFGDIER